MMVPTEEDGSNEIDYDGDYRPNFHDFYDLMKFRVSKILLVSSLYDAFTLEEDGLIFEQISNEYGDLALPFPPQVIRVSSAKLAIDELMKERYELVITMARVGDMDPFEFGLKAKKIQPDTKVFMLLTDMGDIPILHRPGQYEGIDKIFFWNGDSALFLAITKYLEDQANMDIDTGSGLVSVILVVENSPRYYSIFLPVIYTVIMKQTLDLMTEGLNEQEKMLRRRTRPKILLAETYEEAKEKLEKYGDYIIGVISDISYPREGKEDENAGFRLVEEINGEIPVLLQSNQAEHMEKARAMDIPFILKTSDSLLQELKEFFKEKLGFGSFIFRLPDGQKVGKAFDLKEFIDILATVPADSIRLHAEANQFSNWLIARGEVKLARLLRPKKVTDYNDLEEIRADIIDTITESRKRKQLGVIIDFPQQNFEFEGTFTRLGGGSLGGKGRGIAFLNALLAQTDFQNRVPGCRIKVPETLSIGTDYFDQFMIDNGLNEINMEELSDPYIKDTFIRSKLSEELRESLSRYLDHIHQPLAIRSSSLLEDSQNQPFAGIYSTYFLPNTCEDDNIRLDQLCQAIKLVYASAFFKSARAYIQTTVHIQEEEKMGVVIQKLVGNHHNDRFYPLFSDVAQSYNFYPVKPLKKEDGIVSVALGLGKIIVEGEKVLNFSPVYPKIIHGFTSPTEIMENSQNCYYALNMKETCYDLLEGEDTTLLKLDIPEAEVDGALEYIGSTFDVNDNRIRDGIDHYGPKFITFAGILKYNLIPLVDILNNILEIGKRGMGRHVEIEFAAEMTEDGIPEFHVVQVRPMVTMKERTQVRISQNDINSAKVYSDMVLGNGVIERIHDIVFIPPRAFDRTKTVEIAEEIGKLNEQLDFIPYILIGPGRWGTKDRFLGIPVIWSQISGVRTIIETTIPGFIIDPSHGTHFFHNMTSLGIPYFTVNHHKEDHAIDWEWLESLETKNSDRYVKHVRTKKPLMVKVNGRSGAGLIMFNEDWK